MMVIEPGDVVDLGGKEIIKPRLYTAVGGHNLLLVLGVLIIKGS